MAREMRSTNMNYKNYPCDEVKTCPLYGTYVFSFCSKTAGNKNKPATKGKTWGPCFVFLCHRCSGEVTQDCQRISCLLLTPKNDTFAIQRHVKPGMDHATWIASPSYLPRPGDCQLSPMHLNTGNSLLLCGQNGYFKFLSWNKYCKAAQSRFVPGEIDTNSFRTGAATSATLLGLADDRIKGARRWCCDLM